MNYVGLAPAPDGMILVGDTNPIGLIGWFHGAPDGSWLRLNGQVVSKAAYPELWAYAQGFLTADQATSPGLYRSVDANTFAVPKLDGLFIRAQGTLDASHVSAALGVKQADDNLAHVHLTANAANSYINAGAGAGSISPAGSNFPPSAMASSGGTEARPVNVALIPCVKALRSVMIPASAMPVPDFKLLDEKTASASASLDFLLNYPDYTSFEFVWSQLVVSSADAALGMRLSIDGGASFFAGGADYQESFSYIVGSAANQASRTNNFCQVGPPISATASDGGGNGTTRLFNPGSSGAAKHITSVGSGYRAPTNATVITWLSAHRMTVNLSAVNAVRFVSSAVGSGGTLTSGKIKMYGLR